MEKTQAIVLTSRRPHTGFKYLRNLLTQWPVEAIYVDGPPEDADEVSRLSGLPYYSITYSGMHFGAARAYFCALRWAATHFTRPRVLILEDDVLPAQEGLEALIDGLEITEGVLCLCDMGELFEGASPGVYSRSPLGWGGTGWMSSKAMLYNLDIVRWLSEQDWSSPDIEESDPVQNHKDWWKDDGAQCLDARLGLMVGKHPVRNQIGVHVPSLFYHVGEESLRFPDSGVTAGVTQNIVGGRSRFQDSLIPPKLDDRT